MNAAINGQSGNGFRIVFKTRTSRSLMILGIILEKLMDKGRGVGLASGSLGVLYRGSL